MDHPPPTRKPNEFFRQQYNNVITQKNLIPEIVTQIV